MYNRMPKLLIFSIGDSEITLNTSLKIRDQNAVVKYQLRGIIYLGGFHFIAQVITKYGEVCVMIV
jgi:hypothetical protein